jgi:hypothetical protein
MSKVNGIINIPCSLDNSFFKYWLKFLSPYHNLSKREQEIAACFLKHRFLLSKAITDNDVLDKVTMSEETKRKIREECNITSSYFQIVMGKFKKTGFIENNKINPKLIPKCLHEGDTTFQLLLNFDLNGEHI